MPDMEKVINGFDVCLKNIDQPDCPNNCPYLSDCSKYENRVVFQPLMRDAIALLKEQKAVKPITEDYMYKCGDCKWSFFSINQTNILSMMQAVKFCPHCGKPILWEGR